MHTTLTTILNIILFPLSTIQPLKVRSQHYVSIQIILPCLLPHYMHYLIPRFLPTNFDITHFNSCYPHFPAYIITHARSKSRTSAHRDEMNDPTKILQMHANPKPNVVLPN
jgi:hypothetical protein